MTTFKTVDPETNALIVFNTANPAKGRVITVQEARDANDPRALYEVFLADGTGMGAGRLDEVELWVGEWKLQEESNTRLIKVGQE